jgi:hypothetical protein
MGGMECVITGLMDEFHSFFQGRRFARELFTLGAAAVSFSVALVNVTPVGTTVCHVTRDTVSRVTSAQQTTLAVRTGHVRKTPLANKTRTRQIKSLWGNLDGRYQRHVKCNKQENI